MSSIIAKPAALLGRVLVDETKYLYAVGDKIQSLQTELKWMQHFLQEADETQPDDRLVRLWVDEIRTLSSTAEYILEWYCYEVTHPRQKGFRNSIKWLSCCMFDALTLHNVGSNIDDLRNRISELIPRMQLYDIKISRQRKDSEYTSRKRRWIYTHIDECLVGLGERTEDLVDRYVTDEDPSGFDKRVEELVDVLIFNKEVKFVGIYGVGGCGKTTLTEMVLSHSAIKEHFDSCVWVSIPRKFERRSVFEDILASLTNAKNRDVDSKKIKSITDEMLSENINGVLLERKCLVVLDDLWNNQSWDSLKSAFTSIGNSSSKVMITTRDLTLTQHVDPSSYSHPIGYLNEEDSWRLLQKESFSKGEDIDPETMFKMEQLRREIVKYCQGQRPAIMVLAGILSTIRTIDELEKIFNNMKGIWIERESGADSISEVLELSYYYLPFYLKPCFMYMGNFPKGFEITTQRLYHLWEAEGLVSITDETFKIEGVSLYDIAESYMYQLVQRHLVRVLKRWPNGRIKSCQLQDIMVDMCLKKCKELSFLSMMSCGSSDAPSKHNISSSLGGMKLCRFTVHLGVDTSTISKSPSSPYIDVTPNIRSLLLLPLMKCTVDVERLLSHNLRGFLSPLRILDLQGIRIKKIPKVIRYCIHLRYLSLRDTNVFDIPSWVFDRKYLETLDLRCGKDIHVVKLSNDFEKLERLRHLYLPKEMDFGSNTKLKLSVDQLQQMETFKNFNVSKCEREDLRRMVNVRIFSFANSSPPFENEETLKAILKSAVIARGRLLNLVSIPIKAEALSKLKNLFEDNRAKIVSLTVKGRIPDGESEIFPQNLTSLELHDCEIGENHLSELEKLPYLEHLQLDGKAVRGNKMSFSDGAFPKLLRLSLRNLSDLEEWKVGEGALPNLQSMKIIHCPKLENIPERPCKRPCRSPNATYLWRTFLNAAQG